MTWRPNSSPTLDGGRPSVSPWFLPGWTTRSRSGYRPQARRALGWPTDGGAAALCWAGSSRSREPTWRCAPSMSCTRRAVAPPRSWWADRAGPEARSAQEMRTLGKELGVRRHGVDGLAANHHERSRTFYRAADVCVVPSRSESFGLVALEAAASRHPGRSPLRPGGLTTLVEDGRTGTWWTNPHRVAFAERTRRGRVRPDPRPAAFDGGRGPGQGLHVAGRGCEPPRDLPGPGQRSTGRVSNRFLAVLGPEG